MQVIEARRTRHLIVRLDRGDELPTSLLRALADAEAKSGWIEGVGSLESAEIAVFDQDGRGYHKTRRIEKGSELVSMSGNVALLGDGANVRLSATLARETDVGLEHCAGQLVWARVYSVELRVTVFDDVTLTRTADDRTGLPVLQSQASTANTNAPQPQPSAEPPRAAVIAVAAERPPMPIAPTRFARPVVEEPETWPDVGDKVTHWRFGRCTILSSDGERVRLQQETDGRIREVSLTMLKIPPPTVDPETGARHFDLLQRS